MSGWANQPVNETTKRRAILPCSPAGRSTLGSPLLPCLVVANGLFIASFILYLTTLAPSVVTLFDDSLEFQLVTYQLGIAHPTGYPLYTLLGKLFTLIIPVGNIAYRVNLMSAFFGAATVVVLYLLILQMAVPRNRGMEGWKDGRMEDSQSSNPPILQSSSLPIFQPSWSVHLGGIAGAVLLAVNPIFWQQATIAEVYTLNAFFVAILLFLATLIKNPGATHSQNESHLSGVLWLAFFTGLSLTHHRTMLLLLPSLLLYLYLTQKSSFWRPAKNLILIAVIGLTPLLLYLYLPLRGHIGSLDGTYQNTWAGFWRQVSASGYGAFIFDNPFGQAHNTVFYWGLFRDQFYTVVPGFIGLFYLFRIGQRKFLLLTGAAFLTYVTFNLFYNVSDIEVFFIPPFLLWAAWSGLGVVFLLQAVARMTTDRRVRSLPLGPPTAVEPSTFNLQRLTFNVLVLAIFAFIIFQLFQSAQPILKARNSWQVHDYGLDILQQPLPSAGHAAIVGILGEMTLLRYFQQTENRRPDLETVAADVEADRLAAVENLLAEGKKVYLTRELPGAPERWSLSAVGPLIQVNPQPVTTLPQVEVEINQPIIPEISLLGYDISRPPQTGHGPAPARLTLFWQATTPLTRSLKISARLLNPVGQAVAVVDAVPVHFAYPTTAWRQGEIIADVYDLALPLDAPPGPYTPLLIWYDPAQNAAEVGRIELESVIMQ